MLVRSAIMITDINLALTKKVALALALAVAVATESQYPGTPEPFKLFWSPDRGRRISSELHGRQ